MIKKTIAKVETMVSKILRDTFKGDGAEHKAYLSGVKDVARDINDVLEDVGELYSIFEHDGRDWVEIAVTKSPRRVGDIALGYSRVNSGMVRVRYEGEGNTVCEVIKRGDSYFIKLIGKDG